MSQPVIQAFLVSPVCPVFDSSEMRVVSRQTRIKDGYLDTFAGVPHAPEDVRLEGGRDLRGDHSHEPTTGVPVSTRLEIKQ